MDTTSRRPQLPALSYLDVDNAKRDDEAQRDRHSAGPQMQHSAPAASPSYQYPPHPPPPYSHPPPRHANSWPDANSSAHTPPDSRRASGEENESLKKPRQSLPSISEALGETSFSHSASSQHTPSHSSHMAPPAPTAPASPPSAARRSFGMDPPQPHNPYTSGSSYQFSSFRQDSAGPQSYPPAESKPGLGISHESRPPLHVQTSQPPSASQQPGTYPPAHGTSPRYESQPSSHGSMGPPTAPYGYQPYPRYQPTSSSQSAGPIYQPSAQYAAPPASSPGWKPESAPSRLGSDDRSGINTYGESVKRHLDLYDLEQALNDIAATSGHIADFSRRYGDQLHQNARAGPPISVLPGIVEVDDMINKARIQVDSLNKIREVILAQQAAYEQQIAEQRQHKAYVEQGPPPQPPAEHISSGMGGKDEFSGPDNKKRRGRAAPPGRCHSCNRAETPEWRRGPDGARTLCNACGLHYAKLTRKQNGANKGSVGTSNLRPKES